MCNVTEEQKKELYASLGYIQVFDLPENEGKRELIDLLLPMVKSRYNQKDPIGHAFICTCGYLSPNNNKQCFVCGNAINPITALTMTSSNKFVQANPFARECKAGKPRIQYIDEQTAEIIAFDGKVLVDWETGRIDVSKLKKQVISISATKNGISFVKDGVPATFVDVFKEQEKYHYATHANKLMDAITDALEPMAELPEWYQRKKSSIYNGILLLNYSYIAQLPSHVAMNIHAMSEYRKLVNAVVGSSNESNGHELAEFMVYLNSLNTIPPAEVKETEDLFHVKQSSLEFLIENNMNDAREMRELKKVKDKDKPKLEALLERLKALADEDFIHIDFIMLYMKHDFDLDELMDYIRHIAANEGMDILEAINYYSRYISASTKGKLATALYPNNLKMTVRLSRKK